ncbi:MAG: PilZ domain-containing protein [Acidobacteriia bacterium]|nr:PilZ domain-containing protein [Terriglobia bacterium]
MEQETREYVTPEIEKRQHRRVKLLTGVRCEALGREGVMVTRDISVGGMFVTEKDPFPADSLVSLSFRIAPTSPLFTCQGKVAYAIKGLGMGVMFSELSEEVRQAVQKFVDESD